MRKKRFPLNYYIEGILAKDRIILSQAITLIESRLIKDREKSQELLEKILPYTSNSLRIGITGVPGVGKSTFIESLGKTLTEQGYNLAVLAIDPSSPRSKGSIMGDKTRMESLATDPKAYIRPSPTRSSLGGVAQRTRETMLLCEAAGFEVIFIETVGVGQSETVVKGMVDFFLLLMLAGAGDELQGIKKGIMEMADSIAITKADGQNLQKAKLAKAEYVNALHLFPLAEEKWSPEVLLCSALENKGIKEIWETILRHQKHMQANNFFEKKRQKQNLNWMQEALRQHLEDIFYKNENVKAKLPQIESAVEKGETPALKAVWQLINLYEGGENLSNKS